MHPVLKELLLCMLWMYIRDDLFSFLPFFPSFLYYLKKKWYETTESMLMYHVLFLAWKYKIQRNSVQGANSLLCHVWVLQGVSPRDDPFLVVTARMLWSRLIQLPAYLCHRTISKGIFVCFKIFWMLSWLRHWGVVETSLFDNFLQCW